MLEHLILNFSHAFLGNKDPKNLETESTFKNELDVQNFGLFDSSSPNFNTFHPGLKPEDIEPKEEDFIYPTYRLLSSVIIHHGTPYDFTNEEMLKKSMGKLKSQTIYPMHETMLGNELGVVLQTEWQESYMSGGVKVPAGINGVLKIDAKANPKIARGILMKPPSIHSASVGVIFKWEKSHTNLTDNEFYNLLGEKYTDGKLVRKVVSEIVFYKELSLVDLGADPYAQIIDANGKLNDPKKAKSIENLNNMCLLSYKDIKEDTLVDLNFNNNYINQINNKNMLELIKNALGDATITEETLESVLTGMVTASKNKDTEITSLKSDITSKDAEIVTLKESITSKDAEIVTLKADSSFIEAGKTAINNKRTSAVNFYKLSVGDKASDAIIESINNSTLEQAEAFETQYRTEYEKVVPLTCKDCNSTNVSRASAVAAPVEPNKPVIEITNRSEKEIRESIFKKIPQSNQ